MCYIDWEKPTLLLNKIIYREIEATSLLPTSTPSLAQFSNNSVSSQEKTPFRRIFSHKNTHANNM